MKSDRELLELAAKAAGYSDLTEWKDCIRDYDSEHAGGPALHRDEVGGECWSWNALTNDGDALRLAVNLEIDVDHYGTRVDTWVGGRMFTEDCGEDACAATRRAIVRAAAAIAEEGRA